MIEIVSNRHLGGARELSQRTKMAESGRRVLQNIADNEFKTGVNPVNFQLETQAVGSHAEAWIAAYRLTPKKGLSALTGCDAPASSRPAARASPRTDWRRTSTRIAAASDAGDASIPPSAEVRLIPTRQ